MSAGANDMIYLKKASTPGEYKLSPVPIQVLLDYRKFLAAYQAAGQTEISLPDYWERLIEVIFASVSEENPQITLRDVGMSLHANAITEEAVKVMNLSGLPMVVVRSDAQGEADPTPTQKP